MKLFTWTIECRPAELLHVVGASTYFPQKGKFYFHYMKFVENINNVIFENIIYAILLVGSGFLVFKILPEPPHDVPSF